MNINVNGSVGGTTNPSGVVNVSSGSLTVTASSGIRLLFLVTGCLTEAV